MTEGDRFCIICEECSEPLVPLRNGDHVHRDCLSIRNPIHLFDERPEIIQLSNKITSIRQVASKKKFSPEGFFEHLFGNRDKQISIERERTELLAQAGSLEAERAKLKEDFITKDDYYLYQKNSYDNCLEFLPEIIEFWPGYPPEPYWTKLRNRAFHKAQGRCQSCRKQVRWESGHLHHKKPLSLGGTNALENLRWLCYQCHQKKHSHRISVSRVESSDGSVITKNVRILKTPIQKIDYAISSEKDLLISYTDGSGETTKRTITPIRRFKEHPPGDRRWLTAFCHLRNEERNFRIDRIDLCKPIKKSR